MPSLEDRLFALHAEVCKAMANPTRLKILSSLQQVDAELPLQQIQSCKYKKAIVFLFK